MKARVFVPVFLYEGFFGEGKIVKFSFLSREFDTSRLSIKNLSFLGNFAFQLRISEYRIEKRTGSMLILAEPVQIPYYYYEKHGVRCSEDGWCWMNLAPKE